MMGSSYTGGLMPGACGSLASVNESLWQDNMELRAQLAVAEKERDALKGQIVRWDAMYQGMMAERDGYWADKDAAEAWEEALLAENRFLVKVNGIFDDLATNAPLTAAEVERVERLEQIIHYMNGVCPLDCVWFQRLEVMQVALEAALQPRRLPTRGGMNGTTDR
jgi:hypothetical protein